MKDLIESILTITDDPRRDYRSDDDVEKKLFELLTKQLHKHDVMQAEASASAKGATVGQRSIVPCSCVNYCTGDASGCCKWLPVAQ